MIEQYFFNDDFFNFKCGGLTSTTWTWSELLEKHFHGLEFFDWVIDPKTKIAKRGEEKVQLK